MLEFEAGQLCSRQMLSPLCYRTKVVKAETLHTVKFLGFMHVHVHGGMEVLVDTELWRVTRAPAELWSVMWAPIEL